MKYIGNNDPKEFVKLVEFSGKELQLFDKKNPTLFSICMYISRSCILPGRFNTLDNHRPIESPEDLLNGVTYETTERTMCPIRVFFGKKIQDAICGKCACRIDNDWIYPCCLERTWNEVMGKQEIVDYTVHSMDERIQRLKDSIKIHQGIKVV